ncbi:glycosyltransferase family 2 protein [Crocinitomicaceae bacterium]|nr:glycosyltransferase family 2 protein [Crocinitomicaceae bacterium]
MSVIIVNYNVEYFVDQCLDAVKKAIKNQPIEIIVMDNASLDGSVEVLKTKHSDCTLVFNETNVGFSMANNQGIKRAKGEYILLLNPDTIVEESTFEKVIAFMDAHPNVGGLGVRMIDGRGKFLPESKRGLPTPKVAFYKIFGLSKLFPKSKRFGQYHLGHLSEHETHKIDVLSGAFMLMRSAALDRVGLLDETFFMYGEDIDLSYRIQQGGYDNYYFPETSIIHYKGESTKKSSVNYVFVFYRAMIIFAEKHFSGNNAWLFSFLINLAIYFRAFIAISGRLIQRFTLPAIDYSLLVLGLFALTSYWKQADIEFPEDLIKYSIPIYGVTWVSIVFFNGGYDKPIKLFKYAKGTVIATALLLIAYAVLPKSLQFSRLFIFLGAAWVLCYYLMSRLALHFSIGGRFKLRNSNKKSFAIIGDTAAFEPTKEVLLQTQDNFGEITHFTSTEDFKNKAAKVDEIVFCSGSLSYEHIIDAMCSDGFQSMDFKIAPENGNHLIGSNSIDRAGELYILNINTLVSQENKRKKRLFDIVVAGGLLLTAPIGCFFFQDKSTYLKNIFKILIGRRSFIGFSKELSLKDVRLPRIKSGIIAPEDPFDYADEAVKQKLNLLYARDYSMRKDFSIVLKSWQKLDR